VVPPDLPNLYVLGLIQPLGALMPLSELQAKWVAGLLAGAYALPDADAMQRSIQHTKAQMAQRYHDSPRHTIQCDFWTYIRTLKREMKQGRHRAHKKSGSAQRLRPTDETVAA